MKATPLPPKLQEEIGDEQVEFTYSVNRLNSVGLSLVVTFLIAPALILVDLYLVFAAVDVDPLKKTIIGTVFLVTGLLLLYGGSTSIFKSKKPFYFVGTKRSLILFKKKSASYPWNSFTGEIEINNDTLILKREGFPPSVFIKGTKDLKGLKMKCIQLIEHSTNG